jgi:apolipoprotein N-acyltransferase
MTSIEFQGYYILFVYLFLSLFLGIQFGLLTLFLSTKNLFALSAFWTLFEWSRLHIACGFSWNPIGLALAFNETPLQAASLFGVLGLSFWVMLVNLFGFKAFREKNLTTCGVWLLLAGAPYLFGWIHLQLHTGHIQGNPLHVALVQTGLLPSEKIPLPYRKDAYILPQEQWQRILSYLQSAKSPAWDLILFPEAVVPLQADTPHYSVEQILSLFPSHAHSPPLAYPFVQNRKASNLFWAKAIANSYQADVVIGLDHYDAQSEKFFNSAFLISPETSKVERYDKRILLPLAEYLPFPWLYRWTKSYGIYDFFSHGKSAAPLKGKRALSVSICYEETFSEGIRKAVRAGGDLLINLTNDNYYPHSLLPEQHFSHARLRTVENGRPLLRCCNTGVTAVIDSLGRVVARFGEKGQEFKQGVLDAHFIPYTYTTGYSLWGDAFLITLCFCLSIRGVFSQATSSSKK